MPFAGYKDFADCMAKNAKRYPDAETRAKVCGSLKAKHEKKMEIEQIKQKILEERKEIKEMIDVLYAEAEKFIQKAIKKPGAFTEWCKRQGFDGVTSECIRRGMASDDPKTRKRAALAKTLRKLAKRK